MKKKLVLGATAAAVLTAGTFGAVSANSCDVSGITRPGNLSPSVHTAQSMMWHAMSPIAPVP